VDRVHAKKTRHYVRCVNRGAVRLRPGVARLIGQARAEGLQLAIATTTTRENVTALLQVTLGRDAMDWFSAVGTAQEVAAKKPDPAVYEWVLEQLRIPASEALAIEDSRNGLLAASGAGLACVVTPTSYSAHEDFAEAAAQLTDLDHHPERPGEPVTLDDLKFWHLRAVRNPAA
jgi:HAD superfamily hydrolase (TIGR01509 family)